jgi:hypothetical protein
MASAKGVIRLFTLASGVSRFADPPYELQRLDEFFGGEHGVGFGFGILARHNAGSRLAPNKRAGLRKWRYGRTPMARTPLVSDNRKLRLVGHVVSHNGPRANLREMSTPAGNAGQPMPWLDVAAAAPPMGIRVTVH